jgi:hypothetical protein
MVGSDDGVRSSFLISAYSCVFLHYPLVHTKQPRVLVAIEGYDYQVCVNKIARQIDRNKVNVKEVET